MGYLGRVFEASEDENRAAILDAVAERAPMQSVLDLGCFDGEFTQRLGSRAGATHVAGMEFIEEHAERASSVGVDVTMGDLEQRFPYDDASFDLVHANQVIEHLRNTDGFLREARRVCRPGGLVVISTNNLASWHNVAMLALGLQPMPIHVSDEVHVGNPMNLRAGEPHMDRGQTHLRLFTGRALVDLAEYHGLELVSLQTSGYYPLPPRMARRMVKIDRLHGAFLIAMLRRGAV